MADGSFVDNVAAVLRAVVEAGMENKLSINVLRCEVAAVGKKHGAFVTGTDRIDGIIYVTYNGNNVVSITQTVAYSRAVPISTW